MSQTHLRRAKSPLEPLKSAGRLIGLNKLYNVVWRHPLRDLQKLARDGGPFERQRTSAGHTAMREAAGTLPHLPSPKADVERRVHILTGERFWHQSAYCVASLQMVSDRRITPIFYSDGTLSENVAAKLRRVTPWAEFATSEAIDEQLEAKLPAHKFPSLRERRKEYVHLRKLTDIHTFGAGWKLVLDSDLLFFRTPDAMLQWFDNPHPMCMKDITDNYGFPLDYLQSMVSGELPRRFNVGLYGMDSSSIDWDRVEHWCARQLKDFGFSYLQEQGLTAMLMAGKTVHVLPEEDYVLMPEVREGRAPRAVMHHYVDHSKRSYFQYGWRQIDDRIRRIVSMPDDNSDRILRQ
jgi:hypothetical protein